MNYSGWFLISMAFMLGMRHGFDFDHLATIDSVTRTVYQNRFLSKIVGFLFSLGHGLVVIVISLIVGSGLFHSHAPESLEGIGNWISITFLFIFGMLNLWNVFQSSNQSNIPTSLKNILSKRIFKKYNNPIYIVLIGALFAFSFDTFSQVALFSLSGSIMGGCLFSGMLGVVFMLGMMTTDGLNGLFVSALIRHANRRSIYISKLVGLSIALFSLLIGSINLSKMI